MSTVPAIWHGPYEGDLGPGQPPLKVGDVVDVTPEMLESSHWTAASNAPAAPVFTPTPPSTPTVGSSSTVGGESS